VELAPSSRPPKEAQKNPLAGPEEAWRSWLAQGFTLTGHRFSRASLKAAHELGVQPTHGEGLPRGIASAKFAQFTIERLKLCQMARTEGQR